MLTAGASVAVSLGGEVVEHGRGDAVLGDPIVPLVWLARTLGEYGVGLAAGEFVLTGSFCRALPVAAGDRFTADFGVHGTITTAFA